MDDILVRSFEIEERWYEQLGYLNGYLFGEDIDLDDFANLLEDTYKWIRSMKAAIKESPAEAWGKITLYTGMCAKIFSYSCNVIFCEDMTDEFKASVFAARLLYDYAVSVETDKDNESVFSISIADCKFTSSVNYKEVTEEAANKQYCYDVHKKDFSEMIEFASVSTIE